jgi:uncharacterized RDD family membrane protein YckC
MHGALNSPAVERALIDALDSELVDTVWQRLLASDEAQRLVERIAQAPEVRAAIAAQSVGFLEDIGRQLRRWARRFDDTVERIARKLLRRKQRTEPTESAGVVTRGVAFALDVGVLNVAFFAVSAALALLASVLLPNEANTPAFVFGVGAWLVWGSLYLAIFWMLTGQTIGMRFLGIRLRSVSSDQVRAGAACRRLFGIALAVITLGLGFLGMLFSERRRGLPDRMARTEVLYMPVEREAAPWSGADG